jgi:hypothetical protein
LTKGHNFEITCSRFLGGRATFRGMVRVLLIFLYTADESADQGKLIMGKVDIGTCSKLVACLSSTNIV